jgi:predicted Rossmann fold flavoprotein
MSYPGCGTTGDAYRWLSELGHTIVTPRPALVPLTGGCRWTHELSGLTLEDCTAAVRQRNQPGKAGLLASRRASWLFTHFGFSGPAAMDISQAVTAADAIEDVLLHVDLVPDLSTEEVQSALSDRSGGRGRQQVVSVLSNWFPQRLASALMALDSRLSPDQSVSELTKSSRQDLVQRVKQLPLDVHGTRGFPKAEVTAGGVQLSEVDPRTLQSRLVPGLFIAGEVLDVDGPIGGFNFQAAFSTGRAAGAAAAEGTLN